MRWLKVPQAAEEWAGGVSPKTLYAAIRAGRLTAARIGCGRNFLLCEEYVNTWLQSSVREDKSNRDEPMALVVRSRGAAG